MTILLPSFLRDLLLFACFAVATFQAAGVRTAEASEITTFDNEPSYVEALRFERDFIAQHPSLAYRINDEAHLLLDGGKGFILRDVGLGCDYSNGECNSLIGYSAIYRHFLVFQEYYESWEYLLIDRRNGRATHVHDVPHLSPDNQRIATAIGNLSDEFFNGISIWHIDASGLHEEWIYTAPDTVGYEFKRWLDPERIALTVETPSVSPERAAMNCWDKREAVAEHGASGWHVTHGQLISMTCYPK